MYTAPGLVMDYYDGNTVTGAVELRPALRDERQLLQHDLRPLDARRAQPGLRPDRQRGRPRHRQGGDGHVTTDHVRRAQPRRQRRRHRRSTTRDPYFDDCSNPTHDTVAMKGRNIGDLLNAKGVSWGWFEGGFARLLGPARQRRPGVTQPDYIPHHEPFQYYASTANPRPHRRRPRSAEIGHDGPANHQYDLTDFWYAALRRRAACRPSASSRRRATRTGTPATPTRSTSRRSWSTR